MQLVWIEWLRNVIVGADLQPDDTIGFFRRRSEKDHGHIACRAQLPANGEAIFARHHDIQLHQIQGTR
jgi:hypothetical protein